MAGNQLFEEKLRSFTPHTHNALTKLVMTMAAVINNTGKKTLFGRDKGQESYSKFLEILKVTLQSMVLDRIIRESTPSTEVVSVLMEKLVEFQQAYPNWQEAYAFAGYFFIETNADAVAVIDRLRSSP